MSLYKCTKLSNSNPYQVIEHFFFFLDYLFIIFRERERAGEREGEKHQCVVASHMALAPGRNPGMCPDWELNQATLCFTACAQSTELHQPGHKFRLFKIHTLRQKRGLA